MRYREKAVSEERVVINCSETKNTRLRADVGCFDSIKDFQRHSESSQESKFSHYALVSHSLSTMNAQNLQTAKGINTKNVH